MGGWRDREKVLTERQSRVVATPRRGAFVAKLLLHDLREVLPALSRESMTSPDSLRRSGDDEPPEDALLTGRPGLTAHGDCGYHRVITVFVRFVVGLSERKRVWIAFLMREVAARTEWLWSSDDVSSSRFPSLNRTIEER